MKLFTPAISNSDLLVFSHLRWDFVFQRPQHLMTRMAKHRRVYFVEEPLIGDRLGIEVQEREPGLSVVQLLLHRGLPRVEELAHLEQFLRSLLVGENIRDFSAWYYTPMAVPYTRRLKPQAVIYDWMDELSLFKGAPPEIRELEKELLSAADLVFTGGHALFEAKQDQHENIHPFPSSIDVRHFQQARQLFEEPVDQANIPGKRIGFFGVLDERFDSQLIAEVADARPDWQIVLIGPVVKIDPASLPVRENIHYLGMKKYQELPAYLAGWDLAIIPFALNESTRYISPTKTPEYLAAGCPVVSTPITDVIKPYGELGLVRIAGTSSEFVARAEEAMEERACAKWKERVDQFLSGNSWDFTCHRMSELEKSAIEANRSTRMPQARAVSRQAHGA